MFIRTLGTGAGGHRSHSLISAEVIFSKHIHRPSFLSTVLSWPSIITNIPACLYRLVLASSNPHLNARHRSRLFLKRNASTPIGEVHARKELSRWLCILLVVVDLLLLLGKISKIFKRLLGADEVSAGNLPRPTTHVSYALAVIVITLQTIRSGCR